MGSQVNERHPWRGSLVRTSRQRQACIAVVDYVVECFKCRCGRAKDYRYVCALSADDREIARGVSKAAFVLFERCVVFLIDDDDAEIGYGSKYG